MQTFNITSRQNPVIKSWLELKKNKTSDFFFVEGEHLVKMAHDNGALFTYISVNDANPYGVDHYVIHPSIVEKITDLKNSPGIFGVCKKHAASLDFTRPVVFLDDLRDPGNLGTILRTGLAFDFINVVASPNSVNFYNDKVIMAGQGAHFRLNLVTMEFNQLVQQAKKHGYQIVATSLKKATPLETLTPSEKMVLVIGNEARGVSNEVLEAADQTIKISMSDAIESLNASIAAAIIMHAYYQKRF